MKLELASFTLVALAGLPLTGCSAPPFDDPFETIEADGVTLVHETKAPIGVTDIGHYGPVVLTNGCLGIEIFGPEGLYVGGEHPAYRGTADVADGGACRNEAVEGPR